MLALFFDSQSKTDIQMSAKKQKANYDASDISVLEGLDPVRKRPGMYTHTESINHIIQEVVDNAFDEVMAGHASRVTVELHEDGSVSIEDDGRGIPVSLHPQKKRPAVELIFTVLHSGGKFNNDGESAYGFSGGLHGVGVSVTNALSERLEVTVWRDGQEHRMAFANGEVVEKLKSTKLPSAERKKTGTRLHAWPNMKYFDKPLVVPLFEKFLRSKAILLKGSEVFWARPDRAPVEWKFDGGLTQYLEEEIEDQEAWIAPRFHAELYHEEDAGAFREGEGFELAIGFTDTGATIRESYVNLISTSRGGRHETGLRAGLFEATKAVAERMKLVPSNVKIEADDLMGRASFILSVKLRDPEFAGQTKERLSSASAHSLVSGLVRDAFELWLNDHPEHARTVVEMVVSEAVRRSKSIAKVDRKKGSGASVLPGKLADCESKDARVAELFLVEGDSAGGSSKMGRNRAFQAILPLRGKLLNTWEVDASKLLDSDTIYNVAVAAGVDPHDRKRIAEVDFSRLRYHKIVILSDADVDGQHIQVLLLTLFYKHFPGLIEHGNIWIARPPLFRVDAPPKRGAKGQRKIYALDEGELEAIQKKLHKEGVSEERIQVFRFKGLGEMNPDQLWETTLNPESRHMVKVSILDAKLAEDTFDLMMAKKNSPGRREWMEREGGSVEIDV